ncbi:hypothetical protein AB1Y20_019134 [Prymnesium parvum]|uniref:Uncharacterized protein n=1 Tax=Prymnesium parvum TaxID=97485 RepID=A0AB34JT90_PRYPA
METHFAKAMGEDASEHILRERIHELRRLAVQSQEARDHGPTVVDDDLTWLSGPADPVVIGPAATAKEQLAEATETDTSLRMMYSDLRNDTLRRELKLEALTNELLTLQREAIDTPQERRHITSRQQTLKEVQERVAEMELKALQAQDYTETLQLVYNRLNRTKHVGEEAVAAVKSQMEDIERQIEIHHQRQRAMTHAAWQERKAAGLNLELVAAQGRMRRKLKEQRRMVLDQRTKSQEEEEAEARAKAAEMAQGLRQQKIGALLGQASWSTLKGNVDRLARLEEQFDKLGELMGFGTLDEEKISRMKLAEEEARARVAQLTEHKAQIDIQYEEQASDARRTLARVGGVDSELHKRRHEYDRLVALVASKQEHGAHQRAKLDEVQRALVHAQTGLSHLAERVATARGVSLHPSVQAARSAQLGHSFIGGVRDDESRRSASSFPEESFSRGDERLRRIEQSALACLAMCEAELVNTLNDVTRMQAAANSTEDKLWFSKEGEQFESRQRVGSAGWGEESGQVVGSTHGVMQLRDSTRDSLNCKISPLAAPSRRWNALSQYNARVDYEDGSSTEGGSCTDSAIGRLNQNVEDWIVERQELRQQVAQRVLRCGRPKDMKRERKAGLPRGYCVGVSAEENLRRNDVRVDQQHWSVVSAVDASAQGHASYDTTALPSWNFGGESPIDVGPPPSVLDSATGHCRLVFFLCCEVVGLTICPRLLAPPYTCGKREIAESVFSSLE